MQGVQSLCVNKDKTWIAGIVLPKQVDRHTGLLFYILNHLLSCRGYCNISVIYPAHHLKFTVDGPLPSVLELRPLLTLCEALSGQR